MRKINVYIILDFLYLLNKNYSLNLRINKKNKNNLRKYYFNIYMIILQDI